MKIAPADRSFGFLVHDIARLLGRRFDLKARAFGLTRAQSRVLATLARQEGINQATLAERLDVEPITLVRLIDRLEAAGWVERRNNPADRRAYLLYLTEKAYPVLERIWTLAAENQEAAFAGLSDDDRDRLFRLLGVVHGNLMAQMPADAPYES